MHRVIIGYNSLLFLLLSKWIGGTAGFISAETHRSIEYSFSSFASKTHNDILSLLFLSNLLLLCWLLLWLWKGNRSRRASLCFSTAAMTGANVLPVTTCSVSGRWDHRMGVGVPLQCHNASRRASRSWLSSSSLRLSNRARGFLVLDSKLWNLAMLASEMAQTRNYSSRYQRYHRGEPGKIRARAVALEEVISLCNAMAHVEIRGVEVCRQLEWVDLTWFEYPDH